MKTVTIIISIIGLILVPLVIYRASQSRADIRYTLSQAIKVGEGREGKIWQQIEVKNTGNSEARDIQVKIDRGVIEHEIVKHSQVDEPQIFTLADVFELRYPVLPPQASFTLTLGLAERKIDLQSMSVSHSKGVGVEAFSKRTNWVAWIAYAFLLGGIGVYTVLSIRMQLTENLEFGSRFNPVEKVLKKKKPFYMGENRWGCLRKQAVEAVVPRWEKYADPSLTKSCELLCGTPPSYLTEDEWGKVRKGAISQLEENIKSKIDGSYEAEDLLPLMRLERPVHIPEATWLRLVETANKRYLELKRRELLWESAEGLTDLLRGKPPEGLRATTWEEYVGAAQKRYFDETQSALGRTQNPEEFVAAQDLSLLHSEDADRLVREAHMRALQLLPDVREPGQAKRFLDAGKPKWLSEEDYATYKRTAEQTLDLTQAEEKYKKKSRSLEEERSKLSATREELSEKLAKIREQLQIVNDVLTDPSVIDRIEDYNNAFAPGNFANLKKVAALIKGGARASAEDSDEG